MEKLSLRHGNLLFLFWLINLAVVLKGIEYIRLLQGISAPILLGVGLLLLGWAYHAAGGFGPMFSAAFAVQQLSRLPEVPDSRSERHRWFLGYGFIKHSRLHALRAQPA